MDFAATPCAKCQLKENSEFTMEFQERKEQKMESKLVSEPDALLPISVMGEAIVQLLDLKPEVRDVVCWRFAGMDYHDIAVLQGVTTAAVELRHSRALHRYPALTALFVNKARKQGRRKKSERRTT
jgi:DNA-directed RNA polymerase specialized sigma24 family protein